MENPAVAASFLENLRSSTSQAHTALEELPVSESILKPDVTDVEYTHYLTLMRDVVKDVEENIYPVVKPYIADLDSRLRTKHIEADLENLGAVSTPAEKPISGGITEEITPGFAFGVLYVLEGSTLGGRVILKNINKVLGHDAENGAAFFNGHGALTGPQWKSFVEQLIGFEAQYKAEAEIIKGANYTFEAIRQYLGGSN